MGNFFLLSCRKIAAENGVSVKKCQSAAVKRSLAFCTPEEIPPKQSCVSSQAAGIGDNISAEPVQEDNINAEPVQSSPSSESRFSETSILSNTSNKTDKRKSFQNDSGVSFRTGDTVCIARSSTSCDHAKIDNVWKTKAKISSILLN